MAPVYLNVYDLCPHNPLLQCLGLGGIYHSGVEAHGVEFAYGAHAHACSGVFCTPPRECAGALGFRASLYVGETDLTPAEVQAVVSRLGAGRYRGNRYHLLQHNCNAFAAELAEALTGGRGRPPPAWVNRLAALTVALHCLVPASWVPPLLTTAGAQPPPTGDRQPLVGGGGAGGQQQHQQPSSSSSSGAGAGVAGAGGASASSPYRHHQSALVKPPTGVVIPGRVEELLIEGEHAGGAGGAAAGIGGAGAASRAGGGAGGGKGGSGRRPGMAWVAETHDDSVP